MTRNLRNSILLAALALPALAQAGGLYMYEIGTSDLGFAGAGTAARAEDASTVYANPAGMTRLSGNQLVAGAQLLYGKADYELDGTGLLGSGDPGNIVGLRVYMAEPSPPSNLTWQATHCLSCSGLPSFGSPAAAAGSDNSRHSRGIALPMALLPGACGIHHCR